MEIAFAPLAAEKVTEMVADPATPGRVGTRNPYGFGMAVRTMGARWGENKACWVQGIAGVLSYGCPDYWPHLYRPAWALFS